LPKYRGTFHDGNVPSAKQTTFSRKSLPHGSKRQADLGREEDRTIQLPACILREVDGARKLLDNMYNQIQADKFTEVIDKVIETHAPPVLNKNETPRFLFTVKIVMAENLVPLDSSPSSTLDTFVTLSDQDGRRVAKTRTIYETVNPPLHRLQYTRNLLPSDLWVIGDETFNISAEKALWLMVGVRDCALVGKHDTVGREYICLDPKRFGDFLVHDLWLNLDTTGRILLRVSMEGEKDDIQFYFGRAFRSLRRSEGDMVRIFIDKVRHTLCLICCVDHSPCNASDVAGHSSVALPWRSEISRQGRIKAGL
jgi:hypothetical protein